MNFIIQTIGCNDHSGTVSFALSVGIGVQHRWIRVEFSLGHSNRVRLRGALADDLIWIAVQYSGVSGNIAFESPILERTHPQVHNYLPVRLNCPSVLFRYYLFRSPQLLLWREVYWKIQHQLQVTSPNIVMFSILPVALMRFFLLGTKSPLVWKILQWKCSVYRTGSQRRGSTN